MSKLFNWAAARLAAAFAFALCFATPLVSWADAITTVNPVTGETETYTYKYVGQSSTWTATDWQNDADPVANPDNAPQTPSSNVWDPILIYGSYTLTAPTLEGWAIRLGLYNGAQVTVPTLNKIQASTTMWFTVDATSKLTLSLPGTGHLGDNQNVNFYVAAPQGLVFNSDFATSQNDTDTFNYYLAGRGSVSFQGISAGTHKIKMADVTLTGTSQVPSKTLVSFASTTKTFTADAAIKVYDTDGTTLVKTVYLATVNTTGTTTLTTSDSVGTCELVQTSTGIDLYYVDGDPDAIVAKTYKPSISVNFTSGTALSTHADVGVGDYAIPGISWNNLIGNNGTLSTVTQVDSTGAASTVAGVGVTISGTRGYWTCSSVSAATDLRQGYIDDADGANASPQVVVSGIPYYSYYAVVYFSNNGANVPFGYVTINGTNYKWDSENSELVECEGTSSDSWGASSPTAWTEGGNYIVTPTIVNSDGNFTIVSHRLSSSVRSGIAAIQIVEVPKTAEEGELVINVSGDTTYTVSENATYTTVYVTGAGTLAFSGEGTITTTTLNVGAGATVPMGSSITPTTVTGSGTVVYDGAQPSTTVGFDDSASWFGTVWVKNVGDTSKGEATDAKVTTRLGSDTTDATSNELNKWGNANSFVKFTNVRAFMAKADVPWTLVLEDDDTNYAWYNNEGWTARSITIAGLKGDGTFWDINDGGCRPFLNFGDASQFTGTIKALGKQVFLNDTTNTGDATSGLAGRITVPANQTLTVASGKTWHTRNGLVVNGTLNANGTLASDSTTVAVSGSGTVVFAGSAPSPTGDAWWKNSAWTGTVQMKSVTLVGTDLAFNDYGNTGSILELNGCSGWVTPAYTCTVPLKITGTLSLNNGYSGKNNAFKVGTLLGDGTISGSSSAPTMVFNVTTDWSGFTGKVQLTNKCVVFGSSIPDSLTEGRIYIAEDAQVTVQNTAEAAWWGVGGIQVDGELRANSLARFGGGTTITTTDNGVFTLTSTGNGSEGETDTDYARIQGTGSLKYEGTGWRALTTNKLSTAVTLVNEQAGDILLSRALTYNIGSLSGSKKFQGNYGSGKRYLNIVQTKDTEWSGTITADGQSRLEGFSLDATSTGTLTLSGVETQTATLAVNGGSVNLAGTWVGDTTVSGTFGGTGTLTGNLTFSDGATFKAFAADDEDGLVVSGTVGYPAEGTVTVDVSAIEPETDVALLKATDLDASKFALATGAPEGYALEVVDGVLTLTVPHVTITVPSIANTTVTVKIGDNTIGTSSGDYNVAPDSVVTVTYAAVDGYEISGTTEYTIDTSKSETTFDPAGSTEVKRYVASITVGETTTKYSSLQAAVDAVAQNKDIVLLDNVVDGATVDREVTFSVVPGEYTYGDIVAAGDYILTTTALEGKTRYTFAQAVIAVTINEVRTLYTMMTANTGIEAANAGPIGTTIEILSGDPSTYVEYLPMFDLNTVTSIFTKVANPVAAVYDGVLQVQVYRSLAEAVAAATAGQTVTLLADDHVSFSLDNLEIAISKALTIDGAGYTVYGVNDYAYDGVHDHDIYISGSGDVTIKNVTLANFAGGVGNNMRTYPIWTGQAYEGTLTLDNVTVQNFNRTAFNLNGGTVVVTNCTITGDTTKEAYFQEGIGVYNANVTIVDTAISNVGSNLEKEDSQIAACIQLGNPNGSATGTGSITVVNGTYSGEYGIIVASNAQNTVSVQGGTFVGGLMVEEGEGGNIAVSGGTFDAAVPAEYCAEGYEPTDDGEGNYTVRIDMGWIYEASGIYKEYTGTWSNEVEYVNGKAHIEDGNTYTANRPSDGRMVTLEMTLSFDDVNDEDETVGDAKAAVKLATGGFKVYTSEGPDGAVTSVWKSVTIEGSDMIPVADQDYKFLFVLDLTNTTYTAALVTGDGAVTNALVLADGSVANIPFASRGNVAPVQKIEFIGSGSVTSIEGSYEDSAVVIEFVDGQVIGSVTLNAAQAAWLNNQNNYEQLCGKILELTVDAFNEAYLLNLDVTSRAYDGTNVLVSTGIAFGKDAGDNDTVIVTVTLTRHGAIEVNGTEAPIIGKLKLMGGNALPASSFEVLQSVEFTDEDFSEGDTTTCTFLKGEAPAKFCKPIIE